MSVYVSVPGDCRYPLIVGTRRLSVAGDCRPPVRRPDRDVRGPPGVRPGQDPAHGVLRYGHAAGRGPAPVDVQEDSGSAAVHGTVVVEGDHESVRVLRRV